MLYTNYQAAREYLCRVVRDHKVKLQDLHDGSHTVLSASGVKLVEASLADCLDQLKQLDASWELEQERIKSHGNKVSTITSAQGRTPAQAKR